MSIFLKFLALINKIIAYLHYPSMSIIIKNKDTNKLNIYFGAFMSYIATLLGLRCSVNLAFSRFARGKPKNCKIVKLSVSLKIYVIFSHGIKNN